MDRYEVIRDVGSGNFGVAKLVRDVRTKEHFAVKFIERGQKVLLIKQPHTLSRSNDRILNRLMHIYVYVDYFSVLCMRDWVNLIR